MIQAFASPLGNHLWQSTLFAVLAAVLALLLKENRAQARYWLWLSASVKFLIPFSLLVGLGSQWAPAGWSLAAPMLDQPGLLVGIEEVFVPSARAAAAPAVELQASNPMPALLVFAWACGFTIVLFGWWRAWRRIRSATRSAAPMHLEAPVKAISSSSILEPGVFGIWRPVLILPDGITDRLTPAQLQAVLAHELCHVRRRDNLFAAIHMAVEAVFWFHPLVWWLGRRIVQERERACDEEVLRLGNEPRVYAEGILKVCEFYLESPLACVAGVTGSNLKKRIGAIMTNQSGKNLDFGKKLLLAAAGVAVVAGPVVFGIVNTTPVQAQSQPATPLAFEVASVKLNKSEDHLVRMQSSPGGRLNVTNVPLFILIARAYNVPFQSSRLTGGPDWIRSARFDIEAKAPEGALPAGEPAKVRDEKMRLMLQNLFADRFKLTIRRETKEQPVYTLLVGKNGPKLKKAAVEEKDCPEEPKYGAVSCHDLHGGQGRGVHGKAVSMSDLALFVSNWTDRPMIDKTGLQGLYEIDTEGWVPLLPRQGPAGEGPESQAMADPSRPTLFAVLERLGLKLEAKKAPIEMFVIEHVEKPSEN